MTNNFTGPIVTSEGRNLGRTSQMQSSFVTLYKNAWTAGKLQSHPKGARTPTIKAPLREILLLRKTALFVRNPALYFIADSDRSKKGRKGCNGIPRKEPVTRGIPNVISNSLRLKVRVRIAFFRARRFISGALWKYGNGIFFTEMYPELAGVFFAFVCVASA